MALTNLLSVINKIQSQPSWQERQRLLQISSLWPEVVGASVAQQTRPTGIYRQVLQVAVSSSTWSQALVFERRRILNKLLPLLAPNLEPIVDIHFSTSKWKSGGESNMANAATNVLEVIPEILLEHPCYIAPTKIHLQTHLKNHLKIQSQNLPQKNPDQQLPMPPTSALEAFRRLSSIVKSQTLAMPKCPRCKAAAPDGELKRWQMCSTCVRKMF